MQFSPTSRKQALHFEVMRARLHIRDHYLKTLVKNIYEDSGQILSLVRFELDIIRKQNGGNLENDLARAGDLLAETIRKLRDMSRNLFPENEILSASGLTKALQQELAGYSGSDHLTNKLEIEGTPSDLSSGHTLILYSVILDILFLIRKLHSNHFLKIRLKYAPARLEIAFNYAGDLIDVDIQEEAGNSPLEPEKKTIKERLELIDAALNVKLQAKSKKVIQLILPLR